MLNEILNKREDREVWRIREQIEIGKLKRVMPRRLPRFVRGVLFRNKKEGQGLAKTPVGPGGSRGTAHTWQPCKTRRNVSSTALHLAPDSLAHCRLEGHNEITKKEKKKYSKDPHPHQQQP